MRTRIPTWTGNTAASSLLRVTVSGDSPGRHALVAAATEVNLGTCRCKRLSRHVFNLDFRDKTPGLAMEVPCIYGVYDRALHEYLDTCENHGHDCLPYDNGSRFGR